MFAIMLPTMTTLTGIILLWQPAAQAIESSIAWIAVIAIGAAFVIACMAAIGSRADLVFWLTNATSDERARLRQRNALLVCKELGRWIP